MGIPRIGSIVTLVVTLALAACGAPAPPPDVVRPVQLTQVSAGSLADTAVFAGEVRPRHEADIGFRIGGKIVARNVDNGARVKKGQTLARLDPVDVGLQAEAAKAQVAAAETEFRFAEAEHARYENLMREKFISASALDSKRNLLDASRARHEQAKANLAVAQNQAAYATLVAPDDGVVTAVTAEPGQVVSAGQPVLRIAREAEREVLISVPENRLDEIKDARALVATLWANPGKMYTAKVREIAPAVDAATRTFAVRVTLEGADPSVQWGMTANVGVVGATDAASALLPLTSIYHRDGNPAVWRYDPATNKVDLASVVVDQYREDGVIVTDGVRKGDWIVAAGVHKLVPGQVVRPYGTGPAPAPSPAAGRTPGPAPASGPRG